MFVVRMRLRGTSLPAYPRHARVAGRARAAHQVQNS